MRTKKFLTAVVFGLLMPIACNSQESKTEQSEYPSSEYSIGDEFLLECFFGSNIANGLLLTNRISDLTEVGKPQYLEQLEFVSKKFNDRFLKRARRIIQGESIEDMKLNSIQVLDYCEQIMSQNKPNLIYSLEAASANIASSIANEVD